MPTNNAPPNCPKCGKPLTKIRYPYDSMLNRDQWESQLPGDLFCECHNNHRGNKPYAYFWESELSSGVAAVSPASADARFRHALDAIVRSSIQGETDECLICDADPDSRHSDDCPVLEAERLLNEIPRVSPASASATPDEWTIECGEGDYKHLLRLDVPGNLKQIVIEFLKWDGGEGSRAYDAMKYGLLRSALRKLTSVAAAPASVDQTREFIPGTTLIQRERERQIESEGYDLHHDTEHDGGELADAAACYACGAASIVRGASPEELVEPMTDTFDSMLTWPWDAHEFKLVDDPIRDLVKAGALIAAEIDRLQRMPVDSQTEKEK